ncbi:MAG: amidohydrolase, partial [Rhodospirillales bacterium]|nr:amidohydrolase [Rhodospirillales bacterium]
MVSAILGGPLIDGTGRDPVANGIVIVDGGRIVAAGAADAIALPKGVRVYDAAGRAILPGFVDCHVH